MFQLSHCFVNNQIQQNKPVKETWVTDHTVVEWWLPISQVTELDHPIHIIDFFEKAWWSVFHGIWMGSNWIRNLSDAILYHCHEYLVTCTTHATCASITVSCDVSLSMLDMFDMNQTFTASWLCHVNGFHSQALRCPWTKNPTVGCIVGITTTGQMLHD